MTTVAVSGCGGGPFPASEEAAPYVPSQNARLDQPLVVPEGYGWSRPSAVGSVFTDGLLLVMNQTDEPLRVIEVEADFVGDGVAFLGAYVAGADRDIAAHQDVAGYPPDDPAFGTVVPAEGAELEPVGDTAGLGHELLLGYRVDEPGRHERLVVRITYEHEGRTWTQGSGAELVVCADDVQPATCS